MIPCDLLLSHRFICGDCMKATSAYCIQFTTSYWIAQSWMLGAELVFHTVLASDIVMHSAPNWQCQDPTLIFLSGPLYMTQIYFIVMHVCKIHYVTLTFTTKCCINYDFTKNSAWEKLHIVIPNQPWIEGIQVWIMDLLQSTDFVACTI